MNNSSRRMGFTPEKLWIRLLIKSMTQLIWDSDLTRFDICVSGCHVPLLLYMAGYTTLAHLVWISAVRDVEDQTSSPSTSIV